MNIIFDEMYPAQKIDAPSAIQLDSMTHEGKRMRATPWILFGMLISR